MTDDEAKAEAVRRNKAKEPVPNGSKYWTTKKVLQDLQGTLPTTSSTTTTKTKKSKAVEDTRPRADKHPPVGPNESEGYDEL